MDWQDVTVASVGFGLYCFALILKSTGLRHLRFAKVIDLAAPEAAEGSKRNWVFAITLLLSTAMMGAALWQSLAGDRSIFHMLALLGAMLVGIRLVGFFYTRVSLVVLEIESDPASKLSLAHLWHSPLIRGGVALMLISAVPVGYDRWVTARFETYALAQHAELEAKAKEEKFNDRYVPRFLKIPGKTIGDSLNEIAFFDSSLIPGKRFVILGRAGVGKSWFLKKLRFESRKRHPDRWVIYIEAKNLDPGEEVIAHVARAAIGQSLHGTGPAIAAALAAAVVLIDGLDEIPSGQRYEVIESIGRFAQHKALARSILIVTSRPIPLGPLLASEELHFEQAELLPLVATESEDQLKAKAKPIQKLTAQLRDHFGAGRKVNLQALGLFHRGPVPVWAALAPDQTEQLLDQFLETAGFKETVTGANGIDRYLPFLSTFRDIDIAIELFFKTLAGEVRLPQAASTDDLRDMLTDAFVRRRIELNYQLGTRNPALVGLVVDELAQQCRRELRRHPQASTLRLSRRIFQGALFEGTTLEEVVLESELLALADDSGGNAMVFNNPALERHFCALGRPLATTDRTTAPGSARSSAPSR